MAFFKFFMAAAPARLVPAPDHRGKYPAITINPPALFVHKPGLFMDLVTTLVLAPAGSLPMIKGCKLNIPDV